MFSGALYYLIIYAHGDLENDELQDESNTKKVCIEHVSDFASCFLFSLETQHTIGYGGRQTTEECPEAIAVMSFQVTSLPALSMSKTLTQVSVCS